MVDSEGGFSQLKKFGCQPIIWPIFFRKLQIKIEKKWTWKASLILVNLSVLDLIRYPPQALDPILRVVEPVGQAIQPEFEFVWCGQPKNVPRGHCSQRSPFLPYPRLHTVREKVYNYYEFRPSNRNSRCTVFKYR